MDKSRSLRGRPVNAITQQQRKQGLMAAAFELLKEKSYRSITIREIAAKADMQSAMISYYFGDKESLFIALIEKLAEQQFERFEKVLDHENPIKEFINIAVDYFAKNSAVTRLIADEVLIQNSALSKRFIESFPKRMAVLLPQLIEKQQHRGKCRADANPEWLAFSLMTLIVMPFIGQSVRQQAWQISDQDVSSQAWSDHIYRLFTAGWSNTDEN
jgi:AcrR family transcriptional regulator